ncbi:MAG: peptide-methionine (S)-S-oxide reductase MsrA [Lachnospiraceae bacterium]|nr:peptide-methionine (S)-S-oxide reductase MsrA [Lachnospiraceae bacterium]
MKKAYFAGGCFWCITPIFKIYGAKSVTCGYAGGDGKRPTYEEVKSQKTDYRETICVEYDESKVEYEKLLEIFLSNVDPYDAGGQFIDRGRSYTLAVFYVDDEQKKIAAEGIDKLERESGKKTFISLESFTNFFEAEDYHQDFYLKNPEEFEKELISSGRKN